MAKTIPRSGLFLLAKQRSGGVMRDKRDKRSLEPQDYASEDQLSYRELLNIKEMFIDAYQIKNVEIGITPDGEYVLNVVVTDPTLKLPNEFQSVTVVLKGSTSQKE